MTRATIPDTWGPLAEPISSSAGPADPVWRDNAYLAFWSPEEAVYGVVHVSTTPNGVGRRARFSIAVQGDEFETIEELDPGTFTSASIDYQLDGRVRLNTPDVQAELCLTPRFSPGDYSAGEVVPALLADRPLRHYQQGADFTGAVTVHGRPITLSGTALRDRTWGYRDENSTFIEHLAYMGSFDEFDFTVMKFSRPDGHAVTDGFILDDHGAHPISDVRTLRDASGLFARCTLTLADGQERVLVSRQRVGGFWVPMGEAREGVVYSCFDEIHSFSCDGATGHGIAEQGYLRRLDA